MLNIRVVLAVLIRPYLWPTAIRAVFDFSPSRWWTRFPFLPIPDRTVIAWRVTTAYGHRDMTLVAQDIISYLRWRRTA